MYSLKPNTGQNAAGGVTTVKATALIGETNRHSNILPLKWNQFIGLDRNGNGIKCLTSLP